LKPQKNPEVNVADLGCGRGEWLGKLSKWGIQNITGVDSNVSMVEECANQGMNAVHQDLFEFLNASPSDSFDLVTAFHVLEHLSHKQLNTLAKELLRVLKPGGFFLFETPNPGNVIVGASSFYLDPTHKRPLPLELAEFFFAQKGFEVKKISTLNGFEMDFKLGTTKQKKAIEAFFDRWFGTGLDYSILLQKPGT
jgi:SAM-dependent methyltransferase